MLEFFTRDRRRVQKRPTVFATIEQPLFIQTIERRHQRGVSDAFFESEINIARADFGPFPGFIEYRALQLAERERRYFVRAAKSTQKKSRSFHFSRAFSESGEPKSTHNSPKHRRSQY